MDQKVQETVGSLNLKIARLNHRLRVLEQDQAISRPYPAYQVNLIQEYLQLQLQLRQLIHHRHEILEWSSAATDRKPGRV